MNKILIGGIFFFILISIATYFFYSKREGFQTQLLAESSTSEGGLLDDYPHKKNTGVSNIVTEDVWQEYPIYQVGSYDQTTNNLKYIRNPDEGRCTRIEFCNTLYDDKKIPSNSVYPLAAVPNEPGKRVGYYRTPFNLLTFENKDNVLY